MKVKSFFHDILGPTRVTKARTDAMKKASSTFDGKDNIYTTAKLLHPGKVDAIMIDIEEYDDFKVFSIKTKDKIAPYYKPVQYLTLDVNIDGNFYTRPFYILSAPFESDNDYILKFVIFSNTSDIVEEYLLKDSKIKDKFTFEIGPSNFYYEPLRDKNRIIAIVNTKTIIPFLSFLKEIENRKLDIELNIYCLDSSKRSGIVKLANDYSIDERKITYLSESIDDFKVSLIKENIASSFFVFLPSSKIQNVISKLKEADIPDRRIREEYYIDDSISSLDDYPRIDMKFFKLTVIQGIDKDVIEINKDESVLSCLERNGFKTKSSCRKGKCGLCRIKIIDGNYYIPNEYDYRRSADKELNYAHACTVFPLSNMTIKINIE